MTCHKAISPQIIQVTAKADQLRVEFIADRELSDGATDSDDNATELRSTDERTKQGVDGRSYEFNAHRISKTECNVEVEQPNCGLIEKFGSASVVVNTGLVGKAIARYQLFLQPPGSSLVK